MAGVGRRGFAAAARAALFTSNMGGEGPRGMLGGPFLDIAAAVRSEFVFFISFLLLSCASSYSCTGALNSCNEGTGSINQRDAMN